MGQRAGGKCVPGKRERFRCNAQTISVAVSSKLRDLWDLVRYGDRAFIHHSFIVYSSHRLHTYLQVLVLLAASTVD